MLLHPDKLSVSGPNVDGGYKVTLHIGEYEKDLVGKLIQLDPEQIKEWEVKTE